MPLSAETQAEILLVEDNPADVRLTQEIIRDADIPSRLHIARDGEQAMAMLRQQGDFADTPRPDLILLDLNLPRKDGREVLAEIKADESLRSIPVIILTTSKSESDIATAYGLHANSYIAKPVSLKEFTGLLKGLQTYWLTMVELPR